MNSLPPVALVTGATGGIGRHVVKTLTSSGWTVVAAARHPGKASPGVHPITMDVRDTASVDSGIGVIATAYGQLDCVIILAGEMYMAAVPLVDLERAADTFEINTMGALRVMRLAFPLVRASGGRFVVVSSDAGHQPVFPTAGVYAASKMAVEALADAMRRECAQVGVAVSVVRLGTFDTPMTSAAREQLKSMQIIGLPFERTLRRVRRHAARQLSRPHPPDVAGKAIAAVVTSARPRAFYSVRPDVTRSLTRLLPAPLLDRILRLVL